MRFAFALFKYFPFGGLQGDVLAIAGAAVRAGHEATLFCGGWEGPPQAAEAGLEVRLLPLAARSNHRRALEFETAFRRATAGAGFDRSVAFNRIGGCDWYFAADNCLAVEYPKKHSRLALKLLPRYRTFLELERRVFTPEAATKILYIAPRQKRDFSTVYHTQEGRFHYLPPGVPERFRRPADADAVRAAKRRELGIGPDQLLLLQVASNFELKGVPRVIAAVAALPETWRSRCRYLVAGDDSPGRLAGKAEFLGGRGDIPELLLAADLMVHPARNEAAGSVLVEAIAAGCPVLCSEACGFADQVREAAGLVTPEPFRQADLDAMLTEALPRLPELAAATCDYAGRTDLYGRAAKAVELISGC